MIGRRSGQLPTGGVLASSWRRYAGSGRSNRSRRKADWGWGAVIDTRRTPTRRLAVRGQTAAAATVAFLLATVLTVLLGLHTPYLQGDRASGASRASQSSASAAPVKSDSLAAAGVAGAPGGTSPTSCLDCRTLCPDGGSNASCAPASTPDLMTPPLPRQHQVNGTGPVDGRAGEVPPAFASRRSHVVSLVELSVSRV